MYVHQNFTQEKLQNAGLKVFRGEARAFEPVRYDITQSDRQVLFVAQACGDTFYTSGNLHSARVRSLVSFTSVFDTVDADLHLPEGLTEFEGWQVRFNADPSFPQIHLKRDEYAEESEAKEVFKKILERLEK